MYVSVCTTNFYDIQGLEKPEALLEILASTFLSKPGLLPIFLQVLWDF